jgi:mono/diheme cytochrome c family protein
MKPLSNIHPRALGVGSLLLMLLFNVSTSEALDEDFFKQNVLPILQKHCFECHGGGDKVRGGLVMTSRESLLKGGESGAVINLDEPSASLLMEAVRYEAYEMPPKGKLPADEIAILSRWIERGLPYEGDYTNAKAETASMAPPVNETTKQFWSFQPVVRPEAPHVKNQSWIRDELDRFILAKLEAANLAPAEEATRSQWLRRVYYDLTGLPPSPQEVTEFLNDGSPEAFEKVVDRLLDSPHYGEKWARHWLDLVRYAETNSYERDGSKPHVWRYRDYVIRSFNEDKPYDQFITEQIAGDELSEVSPESIIATGYYRLGRWDDEPADPELAKYDDLDDIVATTGQVFLGLTVNCARCHDHKIDPIPQADYYSFLSFFQNIRRYGVRSNDTVLAASVREIASKEQKALQQEEIEKHREQVEANQQRLETFLKPVIDDFEPVEHEEFKHEMNRVPLVKKRIGSIIDQTQFDEFQKLERRRKQLKNFRPSALDSALCVKEHGSTAPTTRLLVRGNPHVPGEEVSPAFLSVLSPPEPQIAPPIHGESTGRRLALARWLTDDANPLTARVMANRIWQYHFGRGIVRSSSDFGFQGTAPTHPELLDYLATELVNSDWKLKNLHRRIVLSASYRMSSSMNESSFAEDPANDLFWRFDGRRLTAEELRDSMLAVNNSLNRDKMYGPSVYTQIPAEVLAGQSRPGSGWGNSSEEDRNRRSIYIHVKRSLVDPFLEAFDAADTDNSCAVRFVTTQPTQALALLNSEFVNQQAALFADTLTRQTKDQTEQVRIALDRVLQRTTTEEEIIRGRKLIQRLTTEYKLPPEEALRNFCLVALNLNEFMYLD